VEKTLMGGLSFDWVRARAGRDGLDTLPLALSKQPHRVGREGGSTAVVSKDIANSFEELVKALLNPRLSQVGHAPAKIMLPIPAQLLDRRLL
jgi:hypothetical protein